MLNMQLDRKVVVETARMDWEASPSGGIWRKPLAREAAEHGHTTSVVRYDPGSAFSRHRHPRGEEILVLDGVFSDEHGDYPAGTYIRNPPGSSHSPRSEPGCELLVLLDQFDPDDTETVRVDTRSAAWLPGDERLEFLPLHDHETEMVALYRWPRGARLAPHQHFGGEEVFVLSGLLQDEYGAYPAGTWIRYPHNSEHCAFCEEDTTVWIKTGHLLP